MKRAIVMVSILLGIGIWFGCVSSSTPRMLKFTVTYDPNGASGGSVPVDKNKYEQGTEAVVLANINNLEKTGNVFAGWNTDNDGTGATYFSDSTIAAISDNMTLYALWIPVEFSYKTVSNGLTITAYKSGLGGSVKIPGGVVSIDAKVFNKNTAITEVFLPKGVKTIGASAFSGCTNLKSIVIPASVNSIEKNAFYNCSGLTVMNIPDSVKTIENNTFQKCSALQEVNIPAHLTKIGEWAFADCLMLKQVTLPETVMYINRYAFNNCTGLTSINLPRQLMQISDGVFGGCKKLQQINIPSYVKSIGVGAFYNCDSLQSVTFPAGLDMIKADAFSDCSGLSRITIPAGVYLVNTGAFSGCENLVGIDVEEGNQSYKSVGSVLYKIDKGRLILTQAPAGLTGEYEIPDHVWLINEKAFYDCAGLTGIILNNSVTNIGDLAFSGCKSLKEIHIPKNVKSIGDGALGFCSGLERITVDENNKYYFSPDGALYDKKFDSTLIQAPGGLTGTFETAIFCKILGKGAFQNCTKLTRINLVDVEQIGEDAFNGCTGLTEFTIPEKVKQINFAAFWNCTNLKKVVVKATTPPKFDSNSLLVGAFNKCSPALKIYVPRENMSSYKQTLGWSSYAGRIFAE